MIIRWVKVIAHNGLEYILLVDHFLGSAAVDENILDCSGLGRMNSCTTSSVTVFRLSWMLTISGVSRSISSFFR